MAGSIFVRPKAAPISGSGAPYAGAKYTFYLTGTSTLATVYTDSALSVAHSNPVIADANGTFAPIWLDPTKTYRAKLTTAANVLIEDIDPVDTKAPTAANVVFTPSGTGAVTTTVQAKLRETVSVKDFGAVGDGVTDDTAAIQAAINSGAKVVTGVQGETYIINNTLLMLSNVTLDMNNATIKGGSSKTGFLNSDGIHIRMSGLTNTCVRQTKITPPVTPCSLSGSLYKAAIVADTVSTYCVVEKCDITLTSTSIVEGISIQNADYCVVQSNKLTNAGIRYSSGGRCNTVIDNTVIAEAIGGTADATRAAYGNVVKNNLLIGPIRMGIEDFSQPGTSELRGTRIEGNTIIGSGSPTYFAISAVSHYTVISNNMIRNWPTGYAIEIGENYGISIIGNSIFWDDGNPNSVTAIQSNEAATTTEVGANVISGNSISNATMAILLRSVAHTVVNGNSFRGCYKILEGQNALSRATFTNNNIKISTPVTGGATRYQVIVGGSSIVENNNVFFETASSGGTGTEAVFGVPYGNCIVANNLVDGNSITSSGGAPFAFGSNGGTGSNVKFLNNIMIGGARVTYNFFTDIFTHGNVCGTISAPASSKMAFFDQQTLAAKPTVTGAKGGNAALTSLLTQLAALGLLTDSTT
jgi:membrane-bound inhibitor of C-type lysozyme